MFITSQLFSRMNIFQWTSKFASHPNHPCLPYKFPNQESLLWSPHPPAAPTFSCRIERCARSARGPHWQARANMAPKLEERPPRRDSSRDSRPSSIRPAVIHSAWGCARFALSCAVTADLTPQLIGWFYFPGNCSFIIFTFRFIAYVTLWAVIIFTNFGILKKKHQVVFARYKKKFVEVKERNNFISTKRAVTSVNCHVSRKSKSFFSRNCQHK